MIRPRLPSLLLLTMLVMAIAAPGAALAGGGGDLLTVTRAGTGSGRVTSNDTFIDCGQACSHDYGMGETVMLTATPNASSVFVGWRGDCSGAGTCQVTMDAARSVRAAFAKSYRPDAWIKLCGLSTGCVIDPLPHPWRGNGVYNTTGRKQTVAVNMEDGEGVRFWITLQNDGHEADIFTVQGCKGTPRFVVNAVLVGKHKRPDWRARNITRGFKNGTAEFVFPPSSQRKLRWFTVNIVAPTTAEGVTYRCPITISSQGAPSVKDTVVAVMTTY